MANRKKKKASPRTLTDEEMRKGCRLGVDSHADVSCVGRHACILEVFHGSLCQVQPFHDGYDAMMNIQTVNAAFAHDMEDGRAIIINVNQALDFTEGMEHSLLCPNQARMNGVIVDDVPKFLDHRKDSQHAIVFPDSDIVVPLSMMGPISYLPVRYPSAYELDTCLGVHLTEDTTWDPGSLDAIDRGVCSFLVQSCDFDADYCNLLRINGLRSTTQREVSPEHLANLWQISIDAARRTLESTTQDSIRVLEGKLHRRVRTQAHQRRYNQLGGYLGMFASDTFKANVKSLRGNKYIQHFCNRGNYAASYPIKLKSMPIMHWIDSFMR